MKHAEAKPKHLKITQGDETDQAILKCKECRDKIKSYRKRGEIAANKKKEKAKELGKKQEKDRAKLYLKQCNFHKEQLKVTDGQLQMIEEQIMNIESTKQMAECARVLQNGNKVGADLQKDMNVEKWEEIKEDMDDLKAQQDEIGDFLKQQNIDVNQYEEGVEEDYNKLISEIAGKEVAKENQDMKPLPDAPKNEVVIHKEEDKQKEKKVVLAA